MAKQPSIATDHVAAFVQLAKLGSLRAAAQSLQVSEQGLRSRLLVLEQRLGTELYRKCRGLRKQTPLTGEGERFLPRALAFLECAQSLVDDALPVSQPQEIHVVASHYLIAYVLVDALRQFHNKYPHIAVRLSARTEDKIDEALLESSEFAFGLAAPYESSPKLLYEHLFSMNWSLICPLGHPLCGRQRVRLADVARFPVITYERGSTGRQHVSEAFQRLRVSVRVQMEATNTDLIVRMVEAGLGVALVPLHPSGAVTKGRKIVARPMGGQIRPIDSGVLRRPERMSSAVDQLLSFLRHR